MQICEHSQQFTRFLLSLFKDQMLPFLRLRELVAKYNRTDPTKKSLKELLDVNQLPAPYSPVY
jgi:hypothetical protein